MKKFKIRSVAARLPLLIPFLAVVNLMAQDASREAVVVDVQHYRVEVELFPRRSEIKGKSEIQFKVLEDTVSLPFDFNRKLSILDVTDEQGRILALSAEQYAAGQIRIRGDDPFLKGSERTLTFRFEGLLEPEEYAFLDRSTQTDAVIDEQGAALLSTGNWFPSHRILLDPATVVVQATVPLGFTAVAPGELQPIETQGVSEVFTWESRGEVTRLPLIVARYFRQNFQEGITPLNFFVTEDFTGDLRPIATEIQTMIEFMDTEFGSFPFPALTLVQIPREGVSFESSGGFLLLDLKGLDETSSKRMELARKVALQWFGHSLKIAAAQDAWLQDGFATYAALRFLEVKHPGLFESQLAKESVAALKYHDEAPVAAGLSLKPDSPQYASIVASKGAWVLYMLGQLAGREAFNQWLGQWYRENAGSVVRTADFVQFVNRLSGEDYGWYFGQWVESVGVPRFETDYTIYRLRSGGFRISGQIKQNLQLFRMPAEVLIETKGEPEEKNVMINGRNTPFSFETEEMPVRIKIDPRGKILRDSEQMQVAVHVSLGEEYKQKGEFVSALEEFERAISLDARNSLAHFRRAEVYFEQHSYSNAADSFREALNGDLSPDWVETWSHIYMGKIYDILGQRQRALAEYQKAINSGVDFNGAQAEAQKYKEEPFTKPSEVIGE